MIGILASGGVGAMGEPPGMSDIRARLSVPARLVLAGQPVWIHFSIENISDEAVTLAVPQTEALPASRAVGLPIAHVLSGTLAPAISVVGEAGHAWDLPSRHGRFDAAPILTIAPHSTVGTRVNIEEFFPVLRSPGTYRIQWRPYRGALSCQPIMVEVARRKQAQILTDSGTMTIRLFYDDAPEHVANFIELAASDFYDNLLFHRIEPGYMIQGGCPRGDGTGIRPDGKRIGAELNGQLHRKGTVSMALLEDDLDSASCQFFICNTRQKDWDGRYTIFGELVGEESFATLDKLMNVEVDEYGQPRQPVRIRSVRITNADMHTP